MALIPDAVGALIDNGHDVVVETTAGEGSKYSDKDFSDAGARIAYDKAEVYKAPILIKAPRWFREDLDHLQLNQTIISPIHLSVLKRNIVERMMENASRRSALKTPKTKAVPTQSSGV